MTDKIFLIRGDCLRSFCFWRNNSTGDSLWIFFTVQLLTVCATSFCDQPAKNNFAKGITAFKKEVILYRYDIGLVICRR